MNHAWPDAKQRRRFFDERAVYRERESERYYHTLLRRYYAFLVPPGMKVLELGCGLGDLLAATRPSRGLGVDFSSKVVELARTRHPQLEFHVCDGLQFSSDEQFDYVLMSDLVNDLPDVQALLENAYRVSHRRTRLIINFHNNLWQPILTLAEWIGAKSPALPQNWLSRADMENLLFLSGWEVFRSEQRILWPIRTPLVERLLNRWAAPLVRHLCLTVAIVARPQPAGVAQICHLPYRRIEFCNPSATAKASESSEALPMTEQCFSGSPTKSRSNARSSKVTVQSSCPSPCPLPIRWGEGGLWQGEGPQVDRLTDQHYCCSVIIPARNEAGNIEAAVQRTPELGLGTEIIFVEGHSKDETLAEIGRVTAKHSHRQIKVLKQRSKGKGGAVREAFAEATGDILFILDADLTVPPEELPKFYEAARSGRGELINGVRLVYPMENEAMQFLNKVANKFFGLAFSWLLGQLVKDTLCGTKVLFRKDYLAIARNRAYFGDFDPFGDFDLLFGAAKLNLGLNMPGAVELPEVVRGLVLEPSSSGHLRVRWNASPRAERYRIFKQVVGTNSDFVPAATVSEPATDLNTFTPGNVVHVRVTAMNEAGETLPSEVAEKLVA